MRITADQINIGWLEAATLNDLKEAMRNGPEVLNAVNALLQTPEGKAIASDMLNDPDYTPKSLQQPDPEEAAQIAADTARAEAEAAAAAAAEVAAAAEALVPPPPPPVVEEKKKIVVDYQATDEDGRSIGRPTHIEGWTHDEVIEKMKAAHINAVRYAERVKTNRFRQSSAVMETVNAQDRVNKAVEEGNKAVDEAIKTADPVKVREAINKSTQAQREAEIAERAAAEHGKIIAETWMDDHKDDFLPCVASSNVMGEYLKANGLVLSYENLNKAFSAVKHKLPPVERQPVASELSVAPAPNVPTSTPAPVTPPAAPIAQPVVPAAATPAVSPQPPAPQPAATAPGPTPATANQPSVARRPGVNGSLPPGTMSAQRPTVQQAPVDTRASLLKEIARMQPAEYRKRLKDANYVKRLEAAGIPVASNVTR